MEISQITDSTVNPSLATGPETLSTQLSICIYLDDEELATSVTRLLSSDRYLLALTKSPGEFFQVVEENSNIDCLIVQEYSESTSLTYQLQEKSTLLPAVIINKAEGEDTDVPHSQEPHYQRVIYHQAEVLLTINQVSQIDAYIDRAIQQFLKLSASSSSTDSSKKSTQTADENTKNMLHKQQRRLAEKLRERLGYLGVYYKRNSRNFLRNMPPGERRKFLEQLKSEYRQIVLNYFSGEHTLNNQIDEFVNLCFFADISVTQIVEIHMDLMDEFSKQLQLEGRSDEILLDYRLTLIDTIAHLCEMYRRSIPRES